MCRRMPGKTVATYIYRVGWLDSSVMRFQDAMLGKEPDRTYLALYVEALEMTPEEEAIFLSKLDPGVTLTPNPELLGKELSLDARIEIDIIPKLKQLPVEYLNKAEQYIDSLAREAEQQ